MKRKVYLAGDMLLKCGILQREQEKKMLNEIGYVVHSPIDDKEINDKQNQTIESNDSLAERIVKKDTEGIINSDIVIIEPLSHAQGTLVELGQIKGMKDIAKIIKDTLNNKNKETTNDNILEEINQICDKFIEQKIYSHYGDIRRTNLPEKGDRRSWSINQYVYGVILDVTEGKGFHEFDEIIEELKS